MLRESRPVSRRAAHPTLKRPGRVTIDLGEERLTALSQEARRRYTTPTGMLRLIVEDWLPREGVPLPAPGPPSP